MDKFIAQAKLFWTGMTRKQKLMLAGGGALALAILLAFVRLLATPEYKPLFSDLEPSDAQSLMSELAAKNIPAKLSADQKSISVPADQVDSARLEVASQGMPHSGRMGFELFDKVTWGQTDFDEKVNYQRAMEGELERTIETLRDVETARVHLVLPTDSVFIDRQRSAKASVILKLRRGSLSIQTQNAIARLVAGSVSELSPENVAVIDADTNLPLNQSHGSSTTGSMEDQLSERLVHTLEPIVGAQNVRASVNVEYDPTTTEENQEKYDPATTVALTMQRSEERVGSGNLDSGVPGTSSNVPGSNNGVQQTSTVDDGGQSSKSESGTYAVNKLTVHTLAPAGRVRRISAALLIDDAVESQQQNGKTVEVRRKRTPEELKQIQELASAAIGLDPSRGDVISVQNLTFEQRKTVAAPAPTRIERIRTVINDWSSVVRYAALLILFVLAYLLMLRPIKKQAVDAFRQLGGKVAASTGQQDQNLGLEGMASVAALSPDSARALSLKKLLAEKIKTEPASGGRLVEAWLRED